MKKKKSGWKIFAALAACMLAMTLAYVQICYRTFHQYEIDDCVNYARGLTRLIAEDVLDVELIDEYLEQGHAYPDYDAMEQRLYHLRDAYPDVVYLYVYQIREDGCHVVFDLDTEEFPGSEPGYVEAFFPAHRPYIPDLLAGKEIPAIESREDYGHVLTVLTPLYDAEGNCRCYVGADCSMNGLKEYTWTVIRQILYFFLAVLAAALIVSVFVADRGVIRRMRKLEHHAYLDTLTGLQNRTAFHEYTGAIERRLESEPVDFSALMIDVNYLKRMNDEYGHEQGNTYLRGAADLLRKTFGEDCVYRIGGDEFAAILEGKAQEEAERNIKALKDEMARMKDDESLQPWEKISAAVGIARFDRETESSVEDTLRRADEEMYRDKVAMKAVRTV